MSGKWKKVIWALLMIQLCLLHVFFLKKVEYIADYYWYKVCVRLNLPYIFYNRGFDLVVLGTCFFSGGIILVFLICYRRFRNRCINSLYPVREAGLVERYEKACARAGIEKESRKVIYKSGRTAMPFVLGFFKPILLLPEWVKEDRACDMLLFHECVHIRHRDTWYKLFLFLCRAVCWYNPLAYLICCVGRRDIEIDCDETVVRGCGREERAAYGQLLIDSLKRVGEKNYAYSAFFSASAREMQTRIRAIMEEKRPYDLLAKAAAALLLTETVLIISLTGGRTLQEHHEEKAPVNIYEGYEKPECFTDGALEAMLALPPAKEDAYSREVQRLPESEWERSGNGEHFFETQGPWQVGLRRSRFYGESVSPLVYRYLSYDRDQTAASERILGSGEIYDPLETSYQRLLAGNQKEAVFAVVLKEYWSDAEAKRPDFAKMEKSGDDAYAYYPLAVHVRMAQDSVYELLGICGMDETVEAFRSRYPENDYGDIPRFVGKPAFETEPGFRVRTSEGSLEIKEDGDREWMTVPVTLEELFTRGDEMDGALTRLQDGSWQCDKVKQIFAYGGCGSYGGRAGLPVSVVYYDESTGGFRISTVTEDYGSVRRLFVSFPENEKVGYLVLTDGRTMWQEETVCFVTEDGGKSWMECEVGEGKELMAHSLTMDMRFVTNEIGFITIRDSAEPDVLRTEDGGRSWHIAEFGEKQEYYSIAYGPFFEGGALVIDVGEEDYGKNGGVKARYTSDDLGKTWVFEEFVLKQ